MRYIITVILIFTAIFAPSNSQADTLYNQSVVDELQSYLVNDPCENECNFNLHSLGSDEAGLNKLKIDINSDGKADFVLSSRENCGAGTCNVALLVSDGNNLRNVFEGQNIAYFSQSTNGFRDLVQGKRGPGQPSYGGTGKIPVYRWNGERYIESGSIDDQTSSVTSIYDEEYKEFDAFSSIARNSINIYELYSKVDTLFEMFKYAKNLNTLDELERYLSHINFLGSNLSQTDITKIRSNLEANSYAEAGSIFAHFLVDKQYDYWESQGINVVMRRNSVKSWMDTLINVASANLPGQIKDQTLAITKAYLDVRDQKNDYIRNAIRSASIYVNALTGKEQNYRSLINNMIETNNSYVEDVAKKTIWISDFDSEAKINILNGLIKVRAFQVSGVVFGEDIESIKKLAETYDKAKWGFGDKYQDFTVEVAKSLGVTKDVNSSNLLTTDPTESSLSPTVSEQGIANKPRAKFLSFPLIHYSNGAYTPKMITSVLDHYMDSPYIHADGIVLSFTNERGEGEPKRQGCYPKIGGGTFSVLGLYTGTNDGCLSHQGLNYDNHPGYDYIAEIGTKVRAAASGTIVNVMNIRTDSPAYQQNDICIPKGIDRQGCSAWGFVGIDHGNGYVTQYGHLSKINVHAGEYVEEGKIIGLTGQMSPSYTDENGVWHQYSVGPHLHFEVLRISPNAPYGYTFVDPYGWEGASSEDYLAGVTGVQNIILWKDAETVDTTSTTQTIKQPPTGNTVVNTVEEQAKSECKPRLNYSSSITGLGAESALSKYSFDQGECQ
jgi:murein DD-endopeptidase MepM/ murein hydrolase activator NlpD